MRDIESWVDNLCVSVPKTFCRHGPHYARMAPKRARPGQSGLSAPARFRDDLGSLFLNNIVSGEIAQRVASSSTSAGARGVEDLARAGASGKFPGNCSRDCLSKLSKGHRKLWAPLYQAEIPLLNLRSGLEEIKKLDFLLPHAVIFTMLKKDPGIIPFLAAKEPDVLRHCEALGREFQCPPGSIVLPIGLHGDGVPFNSPRTKSIEIFSWNLAGLAWPEGGLRVPLTAIPKHFVLKNRTFDAILNVFVWSMRMLALGSCPTARHDASAWQPADGLSRFAGQDIGARGCLYEVRGDWSWFKTTLRLPGWRDGGGCCWLCSTKPETVRDCGRQAAWRTDRLSHSDFLARSRAKGEEPSCIFSLPGVTNTTCRADWLHCCDLGITPDALANIFLTVLRKFPGNLKKKVDQLWREMQAWYRRTQASSRLDNLTLSMLVQPKKPPKLRSKGAEARHLVPFGAELALRHLQQDNAYEAKVIKIAVQLDRLYSYLDLAHFSAAGMADASEQLASQWVELEACSPGKAWRVKPKLHLVLELCCDTALRHGSPTLYWCYKDEDAGGRSAKAAARRGGKQTAPSAARQVLLRFMAVHVPPRSVDMSRKRQRT